VAVKYDDQALVGERLDAGVVDLQRRGADEVLVGVEILGGNHARLFGHPQAEREPNTVEPLLGDELGQRAAVREIQPGRHPHILAGAIPVHPGQAHALAVGIHDEPATRRQRRSNSQTVTSNH
jgi:hypothetical protein